jgi:hypothetical protein
VIRSARGGGGGLEVKVGMHVRPQGQSGYACAIAKSGKNGSVLDMGQDNRVSCLYIKDMKIVKIEH